MLIFVVAFLEAASTPGTILPLSARPYSPQTKLFMGPSNHSAGATLVDLLISWVCPLDFMLPLDTRMHRAPATNQQQQLFGLANRAQGNANWRPLLCKTTALAEGLSDDRSVAARLIV